jgi:dTDP-4-dehydrorhamnose reductase
MTEVLVLGAQGMLGSMVAQVLGRSSGLQVTAVARNAADGTVRFDLREDALGPLLDREAYDWIVNAIGIIKPRIDERSAASVEDAIEVNALFPHRLAAEAAKRGQRVVQIATDCVFSGVTGAYDESAPHDPTDVYGKTKSLGEVRADNVVHLRCSIIGPELPPPTSLLGWILSAEPSAELRGFTDHRWNGVTTLQFARLCEAVIGGVAVSSAQHVIPGDAVNKAELLELVLGAFERDDVTVRHDVGPTSVDRTLSTHDPEANRRLWKAAGYDEPPTIAEMLTELAWHVHAAAGQPA